MKHFVILSMLVAAAAQSSTSPDFAGYPGEPPLVSKPAEPSLSTPKARRFKTVLREAAKQGPNFNGHYRVVEWGGGTNIIEWAIIDLVTGRVWFAKEPAIGCWSPSEGDNAKVPDWFDIKITSRLLVLHECDDVGGHYNSRLYEWQDGSLKFLRSEPLKY